ncbi:MAG: hypothetical protein KME08_17245 [Aphanothece sp. CMT-3BRIN-NPC111]|nr:hypothetical protein [Aphanothece sp. CMT-3BRIN-NPC111]
MILQDRYGRSQNSQDVFLHRSCFLYSQVTSGYTPNWKIEYPTSRSSFCRTKVVYKA